MSWIQQNFGVSVPLTRVTAILLLCYLFGGLSAGYWLVRWRLGRDIRGLGSGCTGAKNVGRELGPAAYWFTGLVDFAKGGVAVWLARRLTGDDRLAALAMVGVVLGHVWPLQLGFRGGKGVATSVGALMIWDCQIALAAMALFAFLFVLLGRTTPGGLLAFALLPLAGMFLERQAWQIFALSVLAGLVLVAHWRNLWEEFARLTGRGAAEPKAENLLE